MSEVRRVCPVGATLGEGPVWINGALWFVDIKERQVHRFTPEDERLASWAAPTEVCWVVPGTDDGLLVGLRHSIARFDPATGAFEQVVEVESGQPGNRLNDAGVGPDGRLWFGSMDDGEEKPTGRLYRADRDGIAPVADGIRITNGPAISPDGRTLYHCDTLGKVIYSATIAADGSLTDVTEFATIEDGAGYPDGPVVDVEGCVWVGLYGGWAVRRYAPDGSLLQEVRFPVANITKIAFGGPDLSTAYATTAAKGLTPEQRVEQPFAGDLFAFDTGVAGQPIGTVLSIGPHLA